MRSKRILISILLITIVGNIVSCGKETFNLTELSSQIESQITTTEAVDTENTQEQETQTDLNPEDDYDIITYEPETQEVNRNLYMTRACSKEAEQKAQDIAATLSGSEYDKVKQIHDYLINNAYYYEDGDMTNLISHKADGVLLYGYGVCESYTNAFALVCYYAGISTELVTGTASNSTGTVERHCWNLVQVDGVWYQIDVTWDDPLTSDGSNHLLYTYFLVPDSSMASNHWASNYSNYHDCTDSRYVSNNELATAKQNDTSIYNNYYASYTSYTISDVTELSTALEQAKADGMTNFLVIYNTGKVMSTEADVTAEYQNLQGQMSQDLMRQLGMQSCNSGGGVITYPMTVIYYTFTEVTWQ